MVCCTRSFAVGILHAPNRWVQLCCFLLYSLFEFQFRFPLLWTCTVLPLRCHNCHYCSTANTTASFAAAATAPCTAVATRLPFCCCCCSVAVVLVFFTFCTDFNSKQLLTSDWFWLVVSFFLFFLSTFLFLSFVNFRNSPRVCGCGCLITCCLPFRFLFCFGFCLFSYLFISVLHGRVQIQLQQVTGFTRSRCFFRISTFYALHSNTHTHIRISIYGTWSAQSGL